MQNRSQPASGRGALLEFTCNTAQFLQLCDLVTYEILRVTPRAQQQYLLSYKHNFSTKSNSVENYTLLQTCWAASASPTLFLLSTQPPPSPLHTFDEGLRLKTSALHTSYGGECIFLNFNCVRLIALSIEERFNTFVKPTFNEHYTIYYYIEIQNFDTGNLLNYRTMSGGSQWGSGFYG